MLAHRQPERGEGIQYLGMGGRHGPPLNLPQPVGKEGQGTPCRDGRIELAQATGRGIAWIDEHLLPGCRLAGIETLEIVTTHVDLAPHLQYRRRGSPQTQGNPVQGAHIWRYVLAGTTVTPGSRLNQHTLLVAQIDGQAIKLELRRIGDGRRRRLQAERTPYPGIEADSPLIGGIGLGVDGQHRQGMGHRRKLG